MTKKELCKRYLLFIISLLFSGIGVAFTKHGALGVSPISSLPNVISAKFDCVSFGTWLMLWNCLLVLGQILILRRKFHPLQLLQIPLSILFGWFTDLGGVIAALIPADNYPMQLCMVILGVLILGFGIALSVIANVIMNAGEAFVRTVADTTKKEFGNVKIAFDIANVALALIASLLLFHGTIVGLREGTILAAVGTGLTVKGFVRVLRPIIAPILCNHAEN